MIQLIDITESAFEHDPSDLRHVLKVPDPGT
jgi:hypothetical protein